MNNSGVKFSFFITKYVSRILLFCLTNVGRSRFTPIIGMNCCIVDLRAIPLIPPSQTKQGTYCKGKLDTRSLSQMK